MKWDRRQFLTNTISAPAVGGFGSLGISPFLKLGGPNKGRSGGRALPMLHPDNPVIPFDESWSHGNGD